MRILDVLYPPRCPICHGMIREKHGLACVDCLKKVRVIREPCCCKCGKGLTDMEKEYCADCQKYQHSFQAGASAFAYDRLMKQSIYQFKYHNKREYAAFYADALFRIHRNRVARWRPEVIVPVPLHRSKYKKRGFNQAQLVALELGRRFQLPVDCGLLVRSRATTPQKELSREGRKNNLKEAFSVVPQTVPYGRILLVDDIYTTGATMDAISELLQKKGVKNTFFLTICVGTDA